MGRRKIEIKAIKDDRNRSVTFLKRKGGLFKKAHELSVLCSVDVAVIIFGNNKKLYEYSSSDLGEILTRYQYYGGANEHKGPADFSGKDKMDDDDDDDDDDASGPSHHGSVEPQMMPSQFQAQISYQHMRHQTSSASPPIPPGLVFPHQHHQPRKQTPQPQLPDKRPISRNANTRPSSNLVPQISQPPNGYAYMSNQTIYNPQAVNMSSHPHAIPPHMQGPSMQNHPMQNSQYANYPPPSSHPQLHPHQHQMHHNYQEDQRKVAIPNNIPQDRHPPRPVSSPQTSMQHIPDTSPSEVEIKQEPQNKQQILVPVKRVSTKSRSIFTPIDESRSILSQHWASSTSKVDASHTEVNNSANQLQSLETNTGRSGNFTATPVGTPSQTGCHTPNSAPESLMRSSSNNSATQGSAKRPVLKVQIPEEASDGESPIVDSLSSPSATNLTSTHSRQNGNTADPVSSNLVLPPPSPSAGTLLSAGASGPPNPFARPPVSQNAQNNANGNSNNNVNGASTSNGNTNNNNGSVTNNNHVIDTPVSALPSRFMTNEFLPSPSSFYPEWNFRGGDGNTLPSPLNFATPIVGTGPSFLRDDSAIKDLNRDLQAKRNITVEDPDGQGSKRLKKE